MYEVKIKKIQGAFRVKVGCQQFFYLTKEALLSELGAYIDDPELSNQVYNFITEDVVTHGDSIPDGENPVIPESLMENE